MTQSVDRDEEPDVVLGQFLRDRSQAAGLSARDIEQRFQRRADQERTCIEAGQEAPVDLVSSMSFSKSHLDRLFKGMASLPSKRFLTVFLEITSSAAGVRPEIHRELHCKAGGLLAAAHQFRRSRRAVKSVEPTPQVSTDVAVATLQVQLELERARSTEDKLRWALGDAQLLMTTLLQIIGALRNIITEIDAQHIRQLRTGADPAAVDVTASQRLEALVQKGSAESQLARVNERRILLETLWGQAHSNVHRFSLHPDVAETVTLPAGPSLPQRDLLSAAVLDQPALADIAAALGKAQEVNNMEERKVREWQENLTSDIHLQPTDEHAILLAATRLSDAANRRTALQALVNNWPRSSETRDALVRLTRDDQSQIQVTAIQSLAQTWPGDLIAREALVIVARTCNSRVQVVAVWALAQAWPGDVVARDALVALTRDRSMEARVVAVAGLAEGWPGDAIARDAILPLTQDSARSVRETTVEVLLESWPGDAVTRDTLLGLLRTDDVGMREVIVEGLSVGWPDDIYVVRALLALLHDADPTFRWAAERGLALSRRTPDDSQSNLAGRKTQGETKGLRDSYSGRRGDGSLVAARIPEDYNTERPLHVISALRRSISFGRGVNVITGEGATGKTTLLTALAVRVGCVEKIWERKSRYISPLARELAKNLDLLWGEKPAPEECFYLGHEFHYASQPPRLLEEILSESSKFRLFLLDEPVREAERARRLFDRINWLARQGRQFIIVTPGFARIGIDDAKIIRLDRRRMRDHLNDLGPA
ncbi:hypothetical protein ABZ769_30475 [Streptomyces olivoreticuli]